MVEIFNKFLFLLLILSALNVIRHAFYAIAVYLKNDDDENIKYKLNKTELFILGVSISYVITSIIKGIS